MKSSSDFGRMMALMVLIFVVAVVLIITVPSMVASTADAARDGGQAVCTSLFQEACK